MSFGRDTIEPCAKHYNNACWIDPSKKVVFVEKPPVDTLEKRLQKQFQKSGAPHGALLVIAQIVRYLTIVIIFPPYLLVYGGPKWIVLKLSPLIEKLYEVASHQVEKLFMQISAWTANLFTGIISRIQRTFAKERKKQKTKRDGDNLFQQLAKNFKHKLEVWKQPFVFSAKATSKLYKQTKEKIWQTKETIRLAVARAYEGVVKFIQSLPSRLSQTAQVTMKRYAQRIWHRTVETLKNPLKWLERPIKRLGTAMKEAITRPFIQAAQFLRKTVQSVVNPVLHFYHKTIVEPTKAVFRAVIKPIEMARAKVQEQLIWMKERVQASVQIFANLGAMVAQRSNQLTTYTVNQFERYQKGIIDKLRRVARAAQRMLDPVKKVMRKIWDQTKEQAKQKFAKGKAFVQKALKVTLTAVLWTVKQVRKLPSYLWLLCKKLAHGFYRACKRFVRVVHFIFVWAKILVRSSFQKMWA